jgi:transposase InsO family protein
MDVMILSPLWDRIFNPYERNEIYRPKNYALVCIDIYSRYVWTVALDNETYDSIAAAMLKILGHMERPKILQGDQKIIEAFEKFLTPYNLGISLTMTKPHETNKNAIVERVIKTLKNDLLKYLYFNPFPIASGQLETTSQIPQEVCLLRNLTVHRMIEKNQFDVTHCVSSIFRTVIHQKFRTVIHQPNSHQTPYQLLRPNHHLFFSNHHIFVEK